jgi:hypothetical protein
LSGEQVVPRIPDETKKRVLAELDAHKGEARRAVRMRVRYRRRMIIYILQVPIAVSYFAVMLFIFPSFFGRASIVELILAMLMYAGAVSAFSIFSLERSLRRTIRLVCLYLSVNAAQYLEKGNLVEGSFLTTKLFEALEDWAEEKHVEIGYFPSRVKNLFLGSVDELQRQNTAVGRALLENNDLASRSSQNLYLLADSLFIQEEEPDLDRAHDALKFFKQISKDYFLPASYLQRHEMLGSAYRILSQVGQLILVPLMLFILWLVFGYKGG